MLFNSDSCFPLTPVPDPKSDKNGFPILSDSDQLIQIINVVGTPTEQDMSFIYDEEAREFLANSVIKNRKTPRMKFHQKYPGATEE